MTNEQNKQKAREIVEQYETRYNDTRDLLWEDLEDIAMQAMNWKDKKRKELWRITRNHYQEWAEEQIAKEKQKLIEKAVEYIKIHTLKTMSSRDINNIIVDFKQVMEGE